MLIALFIFCTVFQYIVWSAVLARGYGGAEVVDLQDDRLAERPVSIIVCFRNEERTLARLIDLILGQTYSGGFELLLVDDNSTDHSASIAHPYVIQHEHVRLLDPGPTRKGKKDALSFGIQAANHELLLLTDADCLPASNFWLRLMVGPLHLGAELVLGASPYLTPPGASLLARWQRFEATYVSLKYLGFARRNQPYMGVGRNLAYTKSFFTAAGGFTAHADLPGGDDDLLVSSAANPQRTFTMVHPGGWTYTYPQASWKDYFRQRARHQSTGTSYPVWPATNLTLIAATHGLFYVFGLALLIQGSWDIVLGGYLLRLFIQVKAYSIPYLNTDPRQYEGAAAGAKSGPERWTGLITTIVFFDTWIPFMYAYLAVAGLFAGREW